MEPLKSAPPSVIEIPELCLVMLVGISSSGKSQWAQSHFSAAEVLSLEQCRALIGDGYDEEDWNRASFDLLYQTADQRLAQGKLTLLDAPYLQVQARQAVLRLAKHQNVRAVAIVLDTPLDICKQRQALRGRQPSEQEDLDSQAQQLRQIQKRLIAEGFRRVHLLSDPEQVIQVQRQALESNLKDRHGPFDLIGDVHGCCDELERLLVKLGYQPWQGIWRHPAGRQLIFVGDLIDRGPRSLDTLELVSKLVAAGQALCVKGNHEAKFERFLLGKNVKINYGLETTLAEIERLPEAEQVSLKAKALTFIQSLVSHYVFDQGKLVVAHAGLKEKYQGRSSGRVKSFAMYGDTTGESDSFGLPVRLDWAIDYRGEAYVVYGHVPVPESEFVNRTLDIDNGCVFGGKLTALRYPENEIVSVPAAKVYYEPRRPF